MTSITRQGITYEPGRRDRYTIPVEAVEVGDYYMGCPVISAEHTGKCDLGMHGKLHDVITITFGPQEFGPMVVGHHHEWKQDLFAEHDTLSINPKEVG